jgi:hypothetical protein
LIRKSFYLWKIFLKHQIQKEQVLLIVILNRWRIYTEEILIEKRMNADACIFLSKTLCKKTFQSWKLYNLDERANKKNEIRKQFWYESKMTSHREFKVPKENDFLLDADKIRNKYPEIMELSNSKAKYGNSNLFSSTCLPNLSTNLNQVVFILKLNRNHLESKILS